jgi:hypothetical protein
MGAKKSKEKVQAKSIMTAQQNTFNKDIKAKEGSEL